MTESPFAPAQPRTRGIFAVSVGASMVAIAIAIVAIFLIGGTGSAEAATCSLTSTAPSTNWTDTTKWSGCGGSYPGANAGDTASIGLGSFTLNVDAAIANGVTLQISGFGVNVAIPAGSTLQIEQSSTISSSNTVNINGGTLRVGAGTGVSLSAPMTMNTGTLTVNGPLTFNSGATFNFNGGTVNGSSILTIASSHALNMSGSGAGMILDTATIDVLGTATFSSSSNTLSINNGGKIKIESGGFLNLSNDAAIQTNNSPAGVIQVLSGGTLQKSGGTSNNIDPIVNNDGTVNAGGGSLNLLGGGTHTGSFALFSSSNVISFSGAHTISATASIAGGSLGYMKVAGGTFSVNSPLTIPYFKQTGGTVNGTQNLTISNSFIWDGGTQLGGGGGSTQLSATATTTMTCATNCTLDNRSLNNQGLINYAPSGANYLSLDNGSILTNTGTIDLQNDVMVHSNDAPTSYIANAGSAVFKKTSGTNSDVLPAINFNGSSKIVPPANGGITLKGGTSSSGSFGGTAVIIDLSASGAHLDLTAGTFSFITGGTGLTISGSGTLNLGGTAQLVMSGSAPLNVQTFNMSGGTLRSNSSSRIGVAGTATLSGGTLDGSSLLGNPLQINAAGIGNVTGPISLTNQAIFSCLGTLNYSSATAMTLSGSSEITVSNGNFNYSTTADINGTSTETLLLNGTSSFTKTGGGTSIINASFNLQTSPLTLTSGSIRLAGGASLTPSAITITNVADRLEFGGSATVQLSGSVATAGSGTVAVLNGGALQVDASVVFAPTNFELNNGGTVFSPGGQLNITNFKWFGGQFTGPGTSSVSATTNMTSLAGSPTLANGWQFINGSSATVSYNPTFSLTFNNGGTAATFTNNGIFDIQGNGTTINVGAGNLFNNTSTGIVKKTAGAGGFTFTVPFTNSGGTVDSQFAGSTIAFNGASQMTSGVIKATSATAAVDFTGGSFTVTGGSFTGNTGLLELKGALFNINTVSQNLVGTFNCSSGSLGGNAAITIPSGATFNWSGGSITGSGGSPFTIQSGGILNADATTSALIFDTRPFQNNFGGIVNYNNGANGMTFQTGATVTNAGAFNVSTPSSTSVNNNTGGTFSNTGTFTHSGAGVLLISVPFVNAAGGTYTESGGTTQFQNASAVTHNGTFDAAAGKFIEFIGGTHTIAAGGFGAGTGVYKVNGGTLTLNLNSSVANFAVISGTLNGSGNLQTTSNFSWQGGTMSGTGTTTVASGSGTLSTGALTLGRNLVLSANTALSSGANLTFTGASAVTNNATFDFQNGTVSCSSCSGAFANAGTIQKSTATGSFNWDVPITGSGALNATLGTLSLNASASLGAVTITNASAGLVATSVVTMTTVNTTAGQFAANSGGVITVSGVSNFAGGSPSVLVNGGTINFNNTTTVDKLNVVSGSLAGSGNVSLTGTGSSWTGGSLAGTGTLTIANTGSWSLTGVGPMTLAKPLVNNGSLAYVPSGAFTLIFNPTGSLTNNNGFQIQNNNIVMSGTPVSTIANTATGSISRIGGSTSAITVGPIVTNAGTALWATGPITFSNGYTQSAGTTTMNANITAPTVAINGGVLTGFGTLTGDLTNGGTINVGGSVGTIAVTGNYTQANSGQLVVDINGTTAGTTYDQMNVSGNVSLNGTFKVNSPLGYTPAYGDTYKPLTFGTNSPVTDFSTKTLPPIGASGFLQASYVAGPPQALQLVAITAQANLGISQSAPASVTHTTNASITLTINNAGPDPAPSVTITDTFANATFVSATPSTGSCTGSGPITCSIPSLASGGSATVTIVLNANTLTSITNSASVSSTIFDSNTADNNTPTATITVTPAANLSLAITGPATASAAATVSYTATVANLGPDSANAPALSLTLTNGTIVSAPGCTVTGNNISCSLATLSSGGSTPITITTTAPAMAGTETLSGSVTSTTTDLTPANNSATASTVINGQADLAITKSLTGSLIAGQNAVYTVTVTNNGPSDASSVVVSDTTPAGLTFVSNSGACATAYPCNIALITSGSSVTITTTYAVPSSATGTVTNTASVASAVADPNGTNNSASTTNAITPNADLAITKVLSSALNAGQNATYTITVTNNGPSDATSVTVSDTPPAGLTFVSNSGACTSAFPCNVGTLVPGQSVTITATFAVAPSASGSLTNTATVGAATPDLNNANNSSSATATVQGADLAVTKSGPASAMPGSQVTYTITVTNNGPSTASGITIADPVPAGATFVSATGACTSFPCSIASLANAASATIQATYTITASGGATVTNTATVSSTSVDPNNANNSASAATAIGCPVAPTIGGPANGATNVSLAGSLNWSNSGALGYNVYFGAVGSGCSAAPFGSTASTSISYGSLLPNTQYEWRVEAVTPGCAVATSSCVTFTTIPQCPQPPANVSPANGSTLSSPITFQWTAVPGATDYHLFASINGGASTDIGSSTTTSLIDVTLANGSVNWYVVANVPGCGSVQSAAGSFTVCNSVGVPLISVVADAASGQNYSVTWEAVAGATKYEIDESVSPVFSGATTNTVTTTSATFHHDVVSAIAFFYRVRAFGGCTQQFGAYSTSARVVLAPIVIPSQGDTSTPNANVPAGSTQVVLQKVFVPGIPGGTFPFTATTDKPWLTVSPSSGLLPPSGITLDVLADPTTLPNGTFTGTIILNVGGAGAGKVPNAVAVSVPVSVSLVTPVTSVSKKVTPANALIIPSVGHLDGFNSKWQSDVRVTNTGLTKAKYQLTFTPDDPSRGIKQTNIDISAGDTTALDDIVKNWYGLGTLGESANGVLEVRPLDGSGKGLDPVDNVSVSTTTVASSRTYNVTSNGTLGQYIPAIPFGNFIAKGAAALSLQQIAQNAQYRTNVGVVEAAGQAATVLLSVFHADGSKIFEKSLDIKANQQMQLNGFLANNGIELNDGRIEVKVTSGDGKVMSYASVVDNATQDPLLVNGVQAATTLANHYVLPGVAALNNGFANWRSDIRVFNSGGSQQVATLTYYPINSGGDPISNSILVNPGEVKSMDDVLKSFFGLGDGAGALHVTTGSDSALVVTGRTYNLTANGTFGQFIPAVTSADGVGKGGRSLNILQVEDSVRYRTNVGIAEVTGHEATVEVSAIVPEAKVSPKITFKLQPNEFVQSAMLHDMGLSNVYNARISVKVIDGDGRITAYGSVIDMKTQDPTYVPAQ